MQKEWTEKYRPKSLREIIGNDLAVSTIRAWAKSWVGGVPRLKALVLRGEPGIGKTSAALALANDMGWDYIEMNASDHRNAASIKGVAGAGSANQTLSLTGEFLSSSAGKRKLIILDEADNLFGREDYGGAKAIVDTIRESAQPIILIVNDYYELTRKAPAIKSLTGKAVFKRLGKNDMSKVLKSIIEREGVRGSTKVLNRIVENANGDLRAAINDLQMMVEGKSEIDLDDSNALGKRNQKKELDSALHSMFRAETVRDARDATFDLDKTPDELIMWIEENVPIEMRSSDEMASAFDAVSLADVYLGRTRLLQHYGLWSYAKELMTGGVALARAPRTGLESFEYRFPSHFMVLSRAKGPRSIRDALAKKLARYCHTTPKRIKESVLPFVSLMAANDQELLIELGKKLGFDDSDVAYLLGIEPGSAEVTRIVSRIGKSESDEGAGAREGKRPRSAAGKNKLTDFRE